MIEIAGLSKDYGDFAAVRGLSLRVERGEVFGFLGPNGAGKTTTIRMLMGILIPTAGRAAIDGLDCRVDAVAVKRRVGYLPDAPVFYDYLRGREIVEFVCEMQGAPRQVARGRARELLDEVALADAAEEFAVNYSTGMKKKLALACALAHEPPVLILDEPTNGLDPRAARAVQDKIKACAAKGKTIFLSTHLLDMAERICTRVGIIHRGALVAAGTPDELRRSVVAGGTLEEIFLELTKDEGAARTAAGASAGSAGAGSAGTGAGADATGVGPPSGAGADATGVGPPSGAAEGTSKPPSA